MLKKRLFFLLAIVVSLSVIFNAFTVYSETAVYASEELADSSNTDISGSNAVSDDAVAEDAEEPGLSEKIARFFADALDGLPDELICFIVSMIPIVELRGGLIIAALKDVPLWTAILVCIAGNLLPVPFILWLITPIFNWLKKTRLFKGFVEKLEKKSMEKSDTIQKKQFWGLVIFVGIPLPGTGAWTGSLIASMLNIKVKKAFPAVCIGLVMATVIMCFLTYGIPWLISNVF